MNRELREAYRAYLQDPTDYPTIDNYARLLSRASRNPEHIEFVDRWRKWGGGKILFDFRWSPDPRYKSSIDLGYRVLPTVLMVDDQNLDERKTRSGFYDAIRYSEPWQFWVKSADQARAELDFQEGTDSWERVPDSIFVTQARDPREELYSGETRYYVLADPETVIQQALTRRMNRNDPLDPSIDDRLDRHARPENIFNSIYHGPVILYVTDFRGLVIEQIRPTDLEHVHASRRFHGDKDILAATELGLVYSDGENLIEPQVPAP